MANPIIKIKRGNGVPTPAGITSGEFAFDKNTNTLYIGASGGYCGISEQGLELGNDELNIIAVGMQISNDETFGSTAPLNERIGYSDHTVPTTRAVKDYVVAVKSSEVFGITLLGGPGIGLTYGINGDTLSVTISNLGVLKGFTSVSVAGSDTIYAKSAIDGITFNSGSGILISGSNADNTLTFTNVGVTGINGSTGNITVFQPISGLSGFTLAVGRAVLEAVRVADPITKVINTSSGDIEIGHRNYSSNPQNIGDPLIAGTYGGVVGGKWYMPVLNVNETGHIYEAIQTDFAINFDKTPSGFVEAVQDIIYGGWTGVQGIAGGDPHNSGIGFTYIDNGSSPGTFTAYLTGIKNLGIEGQSPAGLCGAVKLNAGTDMSLAYQLGSNAIQINYAGSQFRTITASKANTLGGYGANASDIYSGGFIGPGTQQVVAESPSDTLKLFAGAGIGISAGELGLNEDGVLFWNSGVRGITFTTSGNSVIAGLSGNLNIKEGNNISFALIGNDTISISASTSGEGLGFIRADYGITQSDLTNNYSGNGITGNIEFIGQNGLITRQEIGNDTKNGDIYVGLSSSLVLPNKTFIGTNEVPAGGDVPSAQIVVPNSRDTFSSFSNPSSSYGTIVNFNRVRTDMLEGGFTADWNYYTGVGLEGTYNSDLSEPGKVLVLLSRPGNLRTAGGGGQNLATTEQQAEVRLLAWPSKENIGAEIDNAFVGSDNAGGGDCPNGCVGFPQVFPNCLGEFGETQNYTSVRPNGRPTVKVNGDLVLRDSAYIEEDLWIRGNVIDAKTGCLIAGSGTNGGGVSTPGGRLGLTGDLTVDGSIYVHGFGGNAAEQAFFNVNDFAVQSNFVKIGGLSGGVILNGNETVIPNHTSTDRGLLLFNKHKQPLVPGIAAGESVDLAKTSFVGIDVSDGRFTFIPDAAVTTNGNIVTVSGKPGSARFLDINNVGITADNADTSIAYINTGRLNDGTPTSQLANKGYVYFNSTATDSANRSLFSLGTNSQLTLNSNSLISVDASKKIVFKEGITFDSPTSSTPSQGAENFAVTYLNSNGAGTKTFIVRNRSNATSGVNEIVEVVDIGKYSTNTAGYSNDLPQQTLYNKTLADNCVIDCGTY